MKADDTNLLISHAACITDWHFYGLHIELSIEILKNRPPPPKKVTLSPPTTVKIKAFARNPQIITF